MSLKVWLPLTGNLTNQGLSNVTITNSGATVDANGKIGNCFAFNGSSSYFKFNYAASNYIKENTIAFWTKLNNVTNNQCICSSRKGVGYGFSIFFIGNKIRFDNCPDNGTNYQSTFNYTFSANTWYHIVLVQTVTQKKMYVNGELNQTIGAGSPSSNTATRMLIGASSTNDTADPTGNYLNGRLNDFRLYDHALSAKEVKEIAKGLVLHYKLDDGYAEATTNLITTTDCLSSTVYNGSTNKYGYGTNTDIYKTVTTFEGRSGTKVYMGTAGLAARPYPYFANLFVSNGTNSPAYKTLSFDYYGTIGTYLDFYKLGSGSGTGTWRNTSLNLTGSATNSIFITVVPYRWNHIELTLHGITDADAQFGYCILGDAHTSSLTNFWFFANAQLETKDHATPYAGVGGSRTNGPVFDVSGYRYDAITNNIVCTGDTPRYSAASTFNGTNSYVKCESTDWMVQGATEMTINFWAKVASWPASIRILSCTESGGFNIEPGNSGYYRFPVDVYTNATQTSRAYQYDSTEIKISDLPVNEWCMITCQYTAAEGAKTYINGQLHHTRSSGVSYGLHYNTNARLFLGCEANAANPSAPYFNGQMSDFRLYYTALSAEDILELYQTSASVDKSGNVYARELVEV